MDLNMRMLMQYLSGAGSAMAQGESPAPALNAITQQQLGAQSQNKLNERYIQLLSGMLSGNFPEGAKWTSDQKGTKIEMPRELITGGGEVEAGTGNVSEPTTQQSPLPNLSINNPGTNAQGGARQPEANVAEMMRGIANPFAMGQAGSISADDLAGLGPEQVSAALGGATNVANLYRQSINDVTNRAYKQALTKQAIAQTEAMGMPEDDRTAAIQNYEYAVEQGYEGDFADFDKETRTANQKDYQAAVDGGYEGSFHQWLMEMKNAGATNINLEGISQREQAKGEGRSKADVRDPEFIGEIEENYPLEDVDWEYRDYVEELKQRHKLSDDEARKAVRKYLVRQDMDRRIRQAFKDQTVEKRDDGWYVNGKLEVRDPYAR